MLSSTLMPNHDNVVTKDEYMKAYDNSTEADFKRADENGDGKTTLEEAMRHESMNLKETLKIAKEDSRKYVAESDKNGDGKLNLEEKNHAVHLRNEAAKHDYNANLFKMSDTNGDGFHDLEEIKQEIIRQHGYTKLAVDGQDHLHYYLPDSLIAGFTHADANNDKVVTEVEFLKAYKDHAQTSEHFKEADHNGDGKHTLEEMAKKIFDSDEFKKLQDEADENSKKLIKQADSNGDGKVSNKEFLAHLLLVQEGNETSREL